MKKIKLLLLLIVCTLTIKAQTIPKYTLLNGDSFSISVKLDSAYNYTTLNNLEVFVGNNPMCSLLRNTLDTSNNPRIFNCRIKSAQTALMSGELSLIIGLKDNLLGVKNKEVAKLIIKKTNSFSVADSYNLSSDLVITILPIANNFAATSEQLYITKGYSAYEIAVQNGFVGNESAWLASMASIASPTFTELLTTPALIISNETASTIASFDANKNVKSLSNDTYPSLTELSYIKGLTTSAQSQINLKFSKPVGLTTNTIPKWNATAFTNSMITDNGSNVSVSGKFGVNNASPHSSSVVDIVSTTGGFLPPRMTTTQRNAISSPAEGLLVFDTTTKKSYTFDGTEWQAHW